MAALDVLMDLRDRLVLLILFSSCSTASYPAFLHYSASRIVIEDER